MKLLVTALMLAGCCVAQVPIPSRPQGYQLLKAATQEQVVVEVFYDHLCDDSKASWPVLKEVVNMYAQRDLSVVSVLVHIFPLPYHHNAYFMQQAGEVVRRDSEKKSLFVDYIQFAFDNQEEFLAGAVEMTETEVKQKIASSTQTALNSIVTADSVLKGFDDSYIVQHSRYAWKYGCSRGISGTPQFLVNGVSMPEGSGYTAKEWETFIDSIINGTAVHY